MHEGQKLKNSTGSDTVMTVWPQGLDVPDSAIDLDIGQTYTVEKTDVGKLKLEIVATRFRVKRNNESSWQAWQELEAGSKTFTPADSDITYFQNQL
jgi:hypothetical protein